MNYDHSAALNNLLPRNMRPDLEVVRIHVSSLSFLVILLFDDLSVIVAKFAFILFCFSTMCVKFCTRPGNDSVNFENKVSKAFLSYCGRDQRLSEREIEEISALPPSRPHFPSSLPDKPKHKPPRGQPNVDKTWPPSLKLVIKS